MKCIANVLIILPTLIVLYIYYPIIKTEIQYHIQTQSYNPSQLTKESANFEIVIPKLGIETQVVENVDPFKKDEYMEALQTGVAHASTSVTPDKNGTTYVFAHSSDNPFSLTRYNTDFYLLHKLRTGDEITLIYQGVEYQYKVSGTKVVKPDQVDALTQSTDNQLILQTCTPVGTSLNRLLVFAQPA